MSFNIPSYIENKPEAIKAKWLSTYEYIAKTDGHELALIVANNQLKKQIVEKQLVGKTEHVRERLTFIIDNKEFIKKTDDGEEYISAVLSDNQPDNEGLAVPESILHKWADQINKLLPVGDVDHELYNNLLKSEISDDTIKKTLENKKGIAKAVKAVVDKGKLWIRAIIDKRYRNLISQAKGLSVEAVLTRDSDKNIVDGDFLGFTFGVNDNISNPRAVILDAS